MGSDHLTFFFVCRKRAREKVNSVHEKFVLLWCPFILPLLCSSLLATKKLLHSRDPQFVILISVTGYWLSMAKGFGLTSTTERAPLDIRPKTMRINAFLAQLTQKWNNSALVAVEQKQDKEKRRIHIKGNRRARTGPKIWSPKKQTSFSRWGKKI